VVPGAQDKLLKNSDPNVLAAQVCKFTACALPSRRRVEFVLNRLGYRLFPMSDLNETIVRTSDPNWLRTLAIMYRTRLTGVLVDDAALGINPGDQTLLQMARVSGLSRREIISVCVALGMSGIGVTMVILAFVDPEPTSKLGLLVGGGAVCVLGGGFSAIRILTNHKPPNIKATAHGIEISWN
jgi:hypothetical protein